MRIDITSGGSVDPGRLYSAITNVLSENELCSMATVSPESAAHIHTAFFAFSPDLELAFLSDPESRHSHHLRLAPTMAVTVFDSHQRWGADHCGIQFFGECHEASGSTLPLARRLYTERFPAYAEFLPRPASDAFHRLRFYFFSPHTLTILDESEFGDTVFVSARLIREA